MQTARRVFVTVKGNLRDWFLAMGQLPSGEFYVTEELTSCAAPYGSPIFGGALDTRLPERSAGDTIERTLRGFAERGRPMGFWWTSATWRRDWKLTDWQPGR